MNNLVKLSTAIKAGCREQNRYRSLIIIGKARCGKSTALKNFCSQNDWKYINFTSDHGFFDVIKNIETYSPQNLMHDIIATMNEFVTNNPYRRVKGVVIDELESVLSTWRTDIQDAFFSMVCSETRLSCGLIITTRLRQHSNTIMHCVKNTHQVYNLTGE